MIETIDLFPAWEVVVSPWEGALEDVRETWIVIAPDFTDAAKVALGCIDEDWANDPPWDTKQPPVVVSVKMISEYVHGLEGFVMKPKLEAIR